MINCLPIDDSTGEKLFSDNHIAKYLWGTYKPNLYFSMKKRQKETPVFGIMWYGLEDNTDSVNIKFENFLKHECDQKNRISYYWPYHNGIDYANEIINDRENNIQFDIKNIKTKYVIEEQSWSTIITGKKLNKDRASKNIGLILYFSLEDFALEDKMFYNPEKINDLNYKLIEMSRGNEYEKFDIKINNKEKLKYSNYQKYRKGFQYNWRVKDFVSSDFKNVIESYTTTFVDKNGQKQKKGKKISFVPFDELGKTKQPNIVAIQLVFSSENIKENENFEILIQYSQNLKKENESLEQLSELINEKEKFFNSRFQNIFELKNINTDKSENGNITFNLDKSSSESLQQMSKEALSNILGGIGYFYGNIKIQNNNEKIEKKELFTATPCRSYFARGFLWDEGFHQLIISKWDLELSIDMVNTWLDTMDLNGWIPREQIRGDEAENQVPKEFIAQNNLIANPPTLIFPIKVYIEHYKYFSDHDKEFGLKSLLIKFYKKLKLWIAYYEKTQKVNDNYQWNKRDSNHNYPSGFDDLPRGMIPNKEENHLDLNIWLLQLEKVLYSLSSIFDKENMDYYKNNINERLKNINNKLYDKELNIFSDFLGPQFKKIKVDKFPRKVFPYLWRNDNKCGIDAKNPIGTTAECNPYSDSPCCSEYGWCGNTPNHCECPRCSKSYKLENRKEYKNKENTYNPHIGYVNLFPIFFGDFEYDKIKNICKFLNNKSELLSEFGIRSLSKNDLLYRTGDDYWRGKIWIHINYLFLNGVYKNYIVKSPEMRSIYYKTRNGIIAAVYKTWEKTHTFYENYDDVTGKGVMNNPFNGWTSTILLVLSENYD